MTRLRRITLDWDFKKKEKVNFYYNRCLRFLVGKDSRIEIKRSNSKGYHVILWTRAKGDKFDMKNFLGNDPNQTRLDKNHPHARQTLFFKKRRL